MTPGKLAIATLWADYKLEHTYYRFKTFRRTKEKAGKCWLLRMDRLNDLLAQCHQELPKDYLDDFYRLRHVLTAGRARWQVGWIKDEK